MFEETSNISAVRRGLYQVGQGRERTSIIFLADNQTSCLLPSAFCLARRAVIFGVNAVSEAEAIAFGIEHNWSVLWGSDIDLPQVTSMFDDSALEEQLRWLDAENSLPIAIEDNLIE